MNSLIQDFVGSTQVFASAVNDVMGEKLLSDMPGPKLTAPQLKVLRLIEHAGAQNVGDLAASLGVSNAAASKAVERLVRRDLIRREVEKADRRLSRLTLTESGREVLAFYENARQRMLAALFRRFPAEELRRTAELLDRMSLWIVTHSARPEEVCLQCGVHYREKCLVQDVAQRDCSFQRYKNRKQETSTPRMGDSDPEPHRKSAENAAPADCGPRPRGRPGTQNKKEDVHSL